MTTRTAALVIDNFLSEEQWQWIQNNLADFMNTDGFVENIHEPYKTGLGWIVDKLKELGLYQEHWEQTIPSWSFINTCLLYTSPSPRDKRQSRMPSSA